MLKQMIFVFCLGTGLGAGFGAVAAPAMAEQCVITIESNDAMQYNVGNIKLVN